MLYPLTIQRNPTPDAEERKLLLQTDLRQSDQLAVAFVDEKIPDFILAWPLEEGTHPAKIVSAWLSLVLPEYDSSPDTNDVLLEFWLAESFQEEVLSCPVKPTDVMTAINKHRISARDRLSLMLLNVNNNVMEIVFSNDEAVQCACVLTELRLKPFLKFFRSFHANINVRSEGELTLTAFHNDKQVMPDAMWYLSPVPVID